MNTKRWVTLTADNFAECFPSVSLSSLLSGLTFPHGRIDPDGPHVAALLSWVANESAKSRDTEYVCTKGDGALILEMVANRLRLRP